MRCACRVCVRVCAEAKRCVHQRIYTHMTMPQTLATIVPPLQANCKTENIRHTLKHTTHARTHARAKSALLHLYLRAQRTHDGDSGTRAYESDMRFGCERVQSRCPASSEWTTLAPTMTLQRSKRMNQRVVSEYLRTTVVLLNPHAFHACVRTYATKSGAVERRRNLCDFTCARPTNQVRMQPLARTRQQRRRRPRARANRVVVAADAHVSVTSLPTTGNINWLQFSSDVAGKW